MPACGIHLELASRVLRDWSIEKAMQPFPIASPGCVGSFYVGCLAPDIGYFPMGDSLVSDLAHYIRTGDLARALVNTSRDSREVAFAWGWVSHLLADISIHPLINQAAAETIFGKRYPEVPFANDPPTHIKVEVGLDAWIPASVQWSTNPKLPILAPSSMLNLLPRVFQQIHGVTISKTRLQIAYQFMRKLAASHTDFGKIFRKENPGRFSSRAYFRLAKFANQISSNRNLDAMLHPLPPPRWLIQETSKTLDHFPADFNQLIQSGIPSLLNYNLDTGKTEIASQEYELCKKAVLELNSRRNH